MPTATATVVENEQKVIVPFEAQGEYDVAEPKNVNKGFAFRFFKRAFDIAVSFFALIILIIPMLIIALCIRLTSEGGALYSQERLGKNGKPFKIVKFRTMYSDSEKDGAQWSAGDDDDRITPIGRFLRNSRIDELPQLWCIFTGKMSFVGPRPERECFYNEFEKYIHGFKHRLLVTPGLTGLAQVNGGYELRPEEKIYFDVEYIEKRSLLFDLKIIFQTVKVVFTHDGAK